jgi:serine/threonine protein kinase
MRLTIDFPDTTCPKDYLEVERKIGSSKFSVYYAKLQFRQTEYAIKIFPKEGSGTTQYHKELALTELNHENIIKYMPLICRRQTFNFILTEYCPYGDFFEVIENGGFNDDVLIRTYFHQLINGLEYLHSQGIAHLDLKLENLMLGQDFQLKIIDFDQAQKITDEKMTSGGTNGYRGPEVREGKCKSFTAADVFSAGVILYGLKAKEFPFSESDSRYQDTFNSDNRTFWGLKNLSKQSKSFFNQEFKELINKMLASDPSKRITIEEIKKSKWYNGPVYESERLNVNMREWYQRRPVTMIESSGEN